MTNTRPAPLFLIAGTIACWSAARSVWWLWPASAIAVAPPLLIATHGEAEGWLAPWLGSPAQAQTPIPLAHPAPPAHIIALPLVRSTPSTQAPAPFTDPLPTPLPRRSRLILPSGGSSAAATAIMPPPVSAALPPPVSGPTANRWSMAAWLFHRQRGLNAPSLSGSGQLGGSQAGVRIARRIDRAGRWEIYGRATASGGDRLSSEGAVGVAFQPITTLPIRLSAERRQRLTGPDGRNAFALFAVGGVSDRAVTDHIRIDGYAAAGIVGARHRDAFAEGWLRARYRVAEGDAVTIDIGAGSWGAAQPNASRLDIGPSASATFQTGRVRSRLSLDYRQRIMGDATPGSGLAITLSSGF